MRLLLPPLAITAFLWATRLNAVSLPQGIAALGLLCLPWWSYMAWKRAGKGRLPLFALVASMYWLFYAVPLFWGDRVRPSMGPASQVPDDAITQAIWMALLGVVTLWVGIRSGIGGRFALSTVRDVPADPRRWGYLRLLLIGGTAFSLYPNSAYIAGEEGRQLVLAFESFIPLAVFIVLFRSYLRGNASHLDKCLIVAYFGAQFILGLASGWLGAWLLVAGAALATYLAERKRVPLVPVLLVVAYVLFFQAGKGEYRATYWLGARQSSPIDQVAAWTSASLSQWQGALRSWSVGPQLFHDAVMRASLLTQTANVVDLTPRVVPYQHGATYQYVAVGWVPRFLWPDKPSANGANQFYQVAYGLTARQGLGGVSIAIGTLTEGYMNFGWLGVVIVMFFLGLLFDFVQRSFLSLESGFLFAAIGIAILVQFMQIESQMAIYLGGLVQKVALALILFIPATYAVRRDKRVRVSAA